MRGQPFRGAHLISPIETTRTVSSELNVIRRICVNKIFWFNLQQGNIITGKRPIPNDRAQGGKIVRIIDRFVASKWRVESTAAIKATETVKAGAIQKVEELGGFGALRFSLVHKFVKALSMAIEELLIVAHIDPDSQALLHLRVEIY